MPIDRVERSAWMPSTWRCWRPWRHSASLFDPAGMTARESMLPEAATRAGWTLDHANSVYEAIFNLAYIVGPGIGGLLIATLGGVNTMWVTAASFVLSILAIAVLRLEGAGRPDRAKLPDGIWSGIVEGISFVWNNKVLRALAFVDLTVTGLYMPMESVLFPKYFTDRNEPAHLGWVLMALSRRRTDRRARLRRAEQVHEQAHDRCWSRC